MLVMRRTEKPAVLPAKAEQQLPLIEATPLEEAWENVFATLCSQLGTATANSWLKRLQVVGLTDGTLTFRADTKFIADTVLSQYERRLKTAWLDVGHEVTSLQFEVPRPKSVA